jgi:hypothetical protein
MNHAQRRKRTPPESGAGLERDSGFAKHSLVAARLDEIGNHQLAAGLQHTDDFAAGLIAAFFRGNVVQAEVGGDHIEGGVGEFDGRGVAILHVHFILHAFEFRVAQGAFAGVAGKIHFAPRIDSTRASGGQAFCRANHQQSRAGADVQHLLVAAPGNAIQHAIAVHVLAVFRIEKHQEAFEDADRSNAKEHGPEDKQDVTEAHAGHKWSGQQRQSSNQEEGANYARRINAVIRFS